MEPVRVRIGGLTLGELETLTCTRLSSLLTLFHTWVTTEHQRSLESWAEFWVELDECACYSKADCSNLAVCATTVSGDSYVELLCKTADLEWCENCVLVCECWKVVFELALVDDDLASAFCDPCVCNGVLAATCSVWCVSRC